MCRTFVSAITQRQCVFVIVNTLFCMHMRDCVPWTSATAGAAACYRLISREIFSGVMKFTVNCITRVKNAIEIFYSFRFN